MYKRSFEINVLILVIAFILCFIVIELLLRIYNFSGPIKIPLFIANPHNTGSYRLKPNFNFIEKGIFCDSYIHINSFGMRWYETTVEKPLGKTRIAFIGDSFTFGHGASRTENTISGICQTEMDSKQYEVMNFGVGGYGLPDEKLILEEEVLRFRPDYVVLMFFNGNDFRDTFLGKDKLKLNEGVAIWNDDLLREKIPNRFRERHTIKKTLIAVVKYLYVYKLVQKAKENIFSKPKKEANQQLFFDFEASNEFTSYTFWSRIDYPEIAKEARDMTLKYFEDIRKICEKNYIKMAVVCIPDREQIYAKSRSGSNYDIKYPQQYVVAYCNKWGIPCLDPLNYLRDYVREHRMNIHYENNVHFNDSGYRLVGILVAKFLKNKVLR